MDSASAHGCKVGLGIAAGRAGRISMLAIDSIKTPAKPVVAPLQVQTAFIRSVSHASRQQQPLAKSREERQRRQMIMRQPLLYDGALLHLLIPHIDSNAPPQGLFVNMKSRHVADPGWFPQSVEQRLQPELVWIGQFRGGDASFLADSISAADQRLNIHSPFHIQPCSCSIEHGGSNDENAVVVAWQHTAATPQARGVVSRVVPLLYDELATSKTLRNAASYSLNSPAFYEPCAYYRRSLVLCRDVFLNATAGGAHGMMVDHELDKLTSGVKEEENTGLLGGFFKGFGFDAPKKEAAVAGAEGKQHVAVVSAKESEADEGAGGGISGFFNRVAASVSEAVAAVVAVSSSDANEDEHKYLDDEESDKHFEEEDDAREKCCYCIPTAPKDQIKYVACNHKHSEYVKPEDDDPDLYGDKNERCEHSIQAHKDFWKCLQRINQLEPLPFGATEEEVRSRIDVELKRMPSALGFGRYIARRKELMNRNRCSLKKGMREGTAKMMVQPPEPDLSPAMALAVIVRCPQNRWCNFADVMHR